MGDILGVGEDVEEADRAIVGCAACAIIMLGLTEELSSIHGPMVYPII